MKHLFIVHSHTLFLTASGTADYLKLNPEDVIYVLTRGFRTSLPVSGREVIADAEYDRLYDIKDKARKRDIRAAITAFDKTVDAWTGGDSFELFVPHLWNPLFKLLQTNQRCRRVSFVQEGAYTVKEFFHNHYSLYQKLRFRLGALVHWGTTRLYGSGWYADGELRHQTSLDAYAVFPEFFKYLDCKLHIVNWPSFDVRLADISGGPVFVFDGFVKHGICSSGHYLDCCRKLVSEFSAPMNYIKFHPAQSSGEKERICSFFSEAGVNFRILDDGLPLELYIREQAGLTLVGLGSSLLYFAKARGHVVHCCDTWLLDDTLYMEYHSQGAPLLDCFFES